MVTVALQILDGDQQTTVHCRRDAERATQRRAHCSEIRMLDSKGLRKQRTLNKLLDGIRLKLVGQRRPKIL